MLLKLFKYFLHITDQPPRRVVHVTQAKYKGNKCQEKFHFIHFQFLFCVCVCVLSTPILFFFKLGIFLVYIFNAIPKVPHTHPPTAPFWPWGSPVLGHIKFASPMGLSLQ